MLRRLLLTAALVFALPCSAQPSEAPAANAQPAVIADSTFGGGGRGAVFFYVGEIDGVPPATDAERMSWRASFFVPGGATVPADARREVAPGLRRIMLVGNHAYMNAMMSLVRPREKVTGVVEVALQPGKLYRVNGVVDPFRREVWLQDDEGRIVPNTHIIDRSFQDAAQGKEMEGAQYTCCNLHYQEDWISDANYITQAMIPAGARIVVKDYGRYRANVLIEGRPMRIGLDFGRTRETREQFVAKLMVAEDPRKRLATYEPRVRQAIERGRVAIGMTREQVLMSLGHPRTDLNSSLDAPRWVYYADDHEEYTIVWSPDGRVQAVEADEPGVKATVLHSAD